MILLALVLLLAGPAAGAEPVLAVFSARTGPYEEALAGFREELGGGFELAYLGDAEPPVGAQTRVVVAFGSRAALRHYPARCALITALAPGSEGDWRGEIRIAMEPEPAVLIGRLRGLQPGLKALGTLHRSPATAAYLERLRRTAAPAGIRVDVAEVGASAELPDRLRELHGRIDALWLPPDALLLNADSVPILLQFARDNRLPLYAPTPGLVEKGAAASIGPSFRQLGRLAARAAAAALRGETLEERVYSAEVELVVSPDAARSLGLRAPPAALEKAGGAQR